MYKILIVEDDHLIGTTYRNKFALEGFQAEVATDGQMAIEKLLGNCPDAMVLDLMLPKLNGVEVLKFVRSKPSLEHIKVIVFTNGYLSHLMEEAWKEGANKCVTKAHCTPRLLVEIVRNTLETPSTVRPKTVEAIPFPNAPKLEPIVRSAPAAEARKGMPEPEKKPLPAAPTPIPGRMDVDASFVAELRETFRESSIETSYALQRLLEDFLGATVPAQRQSILSHLYRKVHSLTGNAALVGLHSLGRLASAQEAFLKELHDKPQHLNGSSLHTLQQGMELLIGLVENMEETASHNPPSILVIDDNLISRRAMTYSLEKAHLKSINIEDPHLALRLLEENTFDLVFVEQEMMGMSGREFFEKLRALPQAKETRVVILTSPAQFSLLLEAGKTEGFDVVTKPFLFMELALKALVYVLQRA